MNEIEILTRKSEALIRKQKMGEFIRSGETEGGLMHYIA